MSDTLKQLDRKIADNAAKLDKARQRHADVEAQLNGARAKLAEETTRQAQAIAGGGSVDAAKLTEIRRHLDALPEALDICAQTVAQYEAEAHRLEVEHDVTEVIELHAEATTLLDPFIGALEKAVTTAERSRDIADRIGYLNPHEIYKANPTQHRVRYLGNLPWEIAAHLNGAANLLEGLRAIKANLPKA